jgi:hypothetical protein
MAFTPFVEETMPFPRSEILRLRRLGGRILFGSDFPNIPHSYAQSIRALTGLDVDGDWLRGVLYHNAADLFDL